MLRIFRRDVEDAVPYGFLYILWDLIVFVKVDREKKQS